MLLKNFTAVRGFHKHSCKKTVKLFSNNSDSDSDSDGATFFFVIEKSVKKFSDD